MKQIEFRNTTHMPHALKRKGFRTSVFVGLLTFVMLTVLGYLAEPLMACHLGCVPPQTSEGGENNNPQDSDPTCPVAEPVSPYSGKWFYRYTDLVVKGVYPIEVVRRYDNQTRYDSPLGYGWAFEFDKRLYKYPDGSVIVRRDCGIRDKYVWTGGAFTPPVGVRNSLVENGDGTFTLTEPTGGMQFYDVEGRLTALQDPQGNRLEMSYDSRGKLPLTGSSPFAVNPAVPTIVAYDFRLIKVVERLADGSLTGHFVDILYHDPSGRIDQIVASDGRVVDYQHDTSLSATNGNLIKVNGLDGLISTFGYIDVDSHNVTSIQVGVGTTVYINTYDPVLDRVTSQTHGYDRYDFTYPSVTQPTHNVTHTIYDSTGTTVLNTLVTAYLYNEYGYPEEVSETLTDGTRYRRVFQLNTAQYITKLEIYEQPAGGVEALVKAVDYDYDTAGNKTLESVTLDSGEVITRTWSHDHNWVASEQTVSSADPGKLFRTEYTFYYDGGGNPTNIKEEKRRRDDGSFQITTYTYDTQGRLLTTTLPDGHVIHNVYTGLFLTKLYHDDGVGGESPFLKEEYNYDSQGNRNWTRDAAGNITTRLYDNRGRVIQVSNALGEETHYTYTGKYLTQIEVGRTVADGEGQLTKRNFSPDGWLQSVQRKKDDGTWLTEVTYSHDSRGKVLTSIDAENRVTQYVYDALGRRTKSIDPKLKENMYAYDALGNRISEIDARLNETKSVYDDLGRLIQTEQLGISPSAVTQYTYDAVGNQTSVTDPENHTTSYTYDTLSRNMTVTQPLGQTVQYAYDARDRIDYKINARIHKIDYEYEPWGAVKAIRYYPNTSASTPDKTVTYTYYPTGNVQSVTDDNISGFSYQYSYDALNRVDTQTIAGLGGSDKRLGNDYDRYGNRNALVLEEWNGSQWIEQYRYQYQYNKLDRLISANLIDPLPFTFDYFAAGETKKVTHPNGVITDYLYEPNGPAQQIKISGTSGVIEQFDYTYDDVRNVDTLTALAGVHDYAYDGINRLTQALHPIASGLPVQEDFAYDLVGNREDSIDPALYDYDINNRISESPGLTYTFDDDGNQIGRSDGATFEYDKDNRLVHFTKNSTDATYAYDPDGRRISKTVNGTTTYYLWDDALLLAEYGSVGAVVKKYTYLPGIFVPIQMEDVNGAYSIHSDHLQAPMLLTDASQSKVWLAAYEAYGNAAINENPDGDGVSISLNQRFPGQYYDVETGLHFNYFRNYDPITGRYLETDPIGLSGGANLYTYADENPVNAVDPFGLQTQQCNADGNSNDNGQNGDNKNCRKPTVAEKLECLEESRKLCESCQYQFWTLCYWEFCVFASYDCAFKEVCD